MLLGGPGNDDYRYSAGDGSDMINDESGDDVIRVTGSNLLVGARRVGDDLVFHLSDGSTPRIVNHFAGSPIEEIRDNGQGYNLATGLTGGSQRDFIVGTDSGDTLVGNGGDDVLFAGDGPDKLKGAAGNDFLDGGFADFDADIFAFTPGAGHDVIANFELGIDKLKLTSGLTGSGQIIGSDTLVTLSDGGSIALIGVSGWSNDSELGI